ncbi:MAG: MutS-related protein, partial [Bacteroidota bacterium]
FRSSFLKEKQSSFRDGKKCAGEALKNLFGLLEKFDYRLNLIMGALLNIFFLFDFHILFALEKWKTQHREEVPAWFDALAEIDALTGYATFSFNNGERLVFPDVQTGDFTLNAKGVGHPLLTKEECVANDVSFGGQPKVLVITGANMAGKSTFLRTLAINLILGMNGAPVCAEAFRFTPCDIRSSINIRDSLVRHESYFYAELQRLKSIAEHVESNPGTLVILDEILRGTNSRDKHHGSMGFLEKLISLNAVVVVATHDLEIGSLETKYPEVATNYCFEVELEGNQLTFDYQLKPGISQKLNASFLMKKMNLFD